MLSPIASGPLPTSEGVEAPDQRGRLRQQLLARVLPLLDQMVETLVAAPDQELFRSVEVRLRDLGQHVAAAAQQTALDERKKGGT
jgi:hypothetical protein